MTCSGWPGGLPRVPVCLAFSADLPVTLDALFPLDSRCTEDYNFLEGFQKVAKEPAKSEGVRSSDRRLTEGNNYVRVLVKSFCEELIYIYIFSYLFIEIFTDA